MPRRALLVASSLVFALALSATEARGGAWTQPEGRAYVRIAGAGIDSRRRFGPGGERVGLEALGSHGGGPVYESREVRLYVEYGLRERLTLYGSSTYKDLTLHEASVAEESHGAADVYLGGRIRLLDGAAPVSLSAEIKIPTAYDAADMPALGSGTADYTTRLQAGAALGAAYATGEVGFRYRAGTYRNEFLYAAEIGRRLAGPAYARGLLRGASAIRGSRAGVAPTGLFDPGLAEPRYVLLDGVLGADLGAGLSLELGLSHALDGRDALAGNTFEAALVALLGRGAP